MAVPPKLEGEIPEEIKDDSSDSSDKGGADEKELSDEEEHHEDFSTVSLRGAERAVPGRVPDLDAGSAAVQEEAHAGRRPGGPEVSDQERRLGRGDDRHKGDQEPGAQQREAHSRLQRPQAEESGVFVYREAGHQELPDPCEAAAAQEELLRPAVRDAGRACG